jgi:hypothetical protein
MDGPATPAMREGQAESVAVDQVGLNSKGETGRRMKLLAMRLAFMTSTWKAMQVGKLTACGQASLRNPGRAA